MHKLVILFGIVFLPACAQLPSNYNAMPTYAFTDTSDTALGKHVAAELKSTTDQSKMLLINEGTDAFVARMSLLTLAERTIDVQYFIWHADLIGKLLFNHMLLAADRGVRVRILLDDINIDAEIENILYAMDQHENIEVRLFNPFSSRGFHLADYVFSPLRMNRRMHNKSFTIDNQMTIVGGRNIGNEYFSADEASNFTDIDVMSIGPVVNDIEKQFDIYWNSSVVYPVKAFDHNSATSEDLAALKTTLEKFRQSNQESKYALDIRDSEMYKRISSMTYRKNNPAITFKGAVNVIYDDPEKGLGKSEEEIVYLISLMRPYLEKVNHTFELISPYFVPGDKGTQYMIDLVKKGIKVRVITNSLSSTDGLMAQSGYSRQRYNLLKGGVEIYELKATSKTKASRSLRRGAKAKSGLHAKTYIFDRENIFIGSFNFDQRSANINAEVGIVYEIPEMADLIASNVFDVNLKEHTYKVILESEPDDLDYEKEFGEMGDIVWIDSNDGKEIRHYNDPDTSWWRRFNEDVFSILPIESQL